MTATDALSLTFAALADPTRRAILARLTRGEASVSELAEPFPGSLQAVSKHLRVLEHAGLVRRGRESRWRPARLDGAPLQAAAAWLGDYQQFWEGTFDRLEDHLRTITDAPSTDNRTDRRTPDAPPMHPRPRK